MTTTAPDAVEELSPQKCSQIGLTCGACTHETARHLASVCKGLRGKAVGQLFVQLYPSAGCAPMHAQFAGSYQEFSTAVPAPVVTPIPIPSFERREVGSSPRRSMAAVA